MATVKYLLQSKSTHAQIYLRLSLGRNKTFKRKTGLQIDFKNWSIKTSFPKQGDENSKSLNIKLRDLQVNILNQVNSANSKGELIDGLWIENKIDTFFGRSKIDDINYIDRYGDFFLRNLEYKVTTSGGTGVSKATYNKYKTILNKLSKFQVFKKRQYTIKDVDLKFRSDLIKYFSENDRLGENTIGRYLKVVKSICIDAQLNGIQVNDQLKHFKGFTVKAPKVTLSFDELKIIKETNLVSENHQIARDWLIIGSYTGQRVSDLLRMNVSFIKKIKGHEFIVLEQVKTGKLVQIPIHREVKSVLEKNNGNFPRLFTKNIDSNKALFNRYLKQLCKIAEINTVVLGNKFDDETKRTVTGNFEKHELVSSHICRRSFATNFYSQQNFPTPLLMNITAHSTEKMFLEYIGKKPIDYSLQLANIWDEEEKSIESLKVVRMVADD